MKTNQPNLDRAGQRGCRCTLLGLALLLGVQPMAPAADSGVWEVRALVPGARASHSAVWTGREMIVWGGGIDGSFLNTGGRYLPARDTWSQTALSNAPSPRWFHAAVWTGREMIVWGGRANFAGYDNYQDGGRYNPETDTWRPLSVQGAPSPRSQCAAVWTGGEMLVWGGATDGGLELNDGARYNPETDTWTPMSNGSGLEPRMEPTGIWTGEELIVFGGMKFTAGELSFGNGARYRPINDTWSPLPEAGGPGSRTGHTAVWTGERMIVYGGREVPAPITFNTGASFNPAANEWTPIPVNPVGSGRMYHAAVWTGSEMIVWGGQEVDGTMLNTGARFKPATGSWTATSQDGAAGKRQFWRPDLGIWSGEAMIIAAGSDYPASLDSTYLYFPTAPTTPPPPPVTVYDVSADFSTSSNPAGPWSYGWKETAGGLFNSIGFGKHLASENGVPIFAWQLSESELPSVARVLGPGTAVSAGGQFVGPPGTLYFTAGASGPLNYGVVRFTVPPGRGGLYALETSVRDVFDGPSQGDTDFHVVRNEEELFNRFLAPHTVAAYSNNLALVAGDTVDFLVGRGQDGDQTGSGLKLTATLKRITNAPPSSTNCAPVSAGLVGWWRAENNADDAAGHGDGLASNGLSYEAGVVGQAFRVDGAQGRINVPDAEAFKLVEALSIEGWVKLVNRDSGLSLFMRGDDRPGLDPYFLGVDQGRITFGISDETDSDWISAPFPRDQWKHVAGTFDVATGSLKLYLDGVLMAQKQTSRRPARELDDRLSPGLGIGNVSGSWINFPWDGWIDEISLYNRALAEEEVRRIYHAGQDGKCVNPVPPPPPPSSYDVSRDYSLAANPNGPWSYGYLTELSDSSGFGLLGAARTFSADNGVPIGVRERNTYQLPIVAKVLGPGTARSDGDHFTGPAGTIYFAPGADGAPENFGVIRFTVPVGGGGLYRLETAVQSLFDGGRSRDADFHVLKNGEELFGRSLPPNSGTGYSNVMTLAVGDTVDFAIGRGADGLTADTGLKIQARLIQVTNAPSVEQLLAEATEAPDLVTQQQLQTSLEAVNVSLARGNVLAALHQLSGFQESVQAQVAPVVPELAEELARLSQQLSESLDPDGTRRARLLSLEGSPALVQRVFSRPGGGMCVESSAVPGSICRVQRSSNLISWVDAGRAVEISDGLFRFVDSAPPEPACFYRLLAE